MNPFKLETNEGQSNFELQKNHIVFLEQSIVWLPEGIRFAAGSQLDSFSETVCSNLGPLQHVSIGQDKEL